MHGSCAWWQWDCILGVNVLSCTSSLSTIALSLSPYLSLTISLALFLSAFFDVWFNVCLLARLYYECIMHARLSVGAGGHAGQGDISARAGCVLHCRLLAGTRTEQTYQHNTLTNTPNNSNKETNWQGTANSFPLLPITQPRNRRESGVKGFVGNLVAPLTNFFQF